MKGFINARLRVKLIICFLAVSLVPLTALTFWNQYQTRQVLLDRSRKNLLSDAENIAIVLNQFVTHNLNSVGVQAQLPTLVKYLSVPRSERSPLESEVKAIFRTLLHQDIANIASYALLDREGTVVVDTHQTYIGRSYEDFDYFQKSLTAGFSTISDVIYSAEEFGPILHFSAPVRDRQGTIIGVLILRYRATILQEMLGRSHGSDAYNSYTKRRVILLDSNGLRLAENKSSHLILNPIHALSADEFIRLQQAQRLPPDLTPADVVSIPELWENLHNRGTSPFLTFHYEDIIKHAAIVDLPSPSWLLVVAQQHDSFFAPIQAQLRDTILLGLLSSGTVTLVASILGYLLTRPILALTEMLNQFARGELNARSQISSQDELGMLAIGFNRMAEQIGQLLKNLEYRSQELELSQSTTVAIAELSTAMFDRHRLLQDTTDLMLEQFGLETVRVYIWDRDRDCLMLQQEVTNLGSEQSTACAIDFPPWVVAAAGDWQPHRNPDTLAATALPIVFNQELVGILELEDSERSHFSEIEHNTFRILANQIAIIWSNAKLISDIQHAEEQSRQQAETLKQTLQELTDAQSQLIQTEKMSSLGQLVAGVAHEINNPVSFIYGNLSHLEEYSQNFLAVFQAYQRHYGQPPQSLQDVIEEADIEFIIADFPHLLQSMRVGARRIQEIVRSLRTFSRLDESERKTVDLHEGIDSTLLILHHRLRANGDRPAITVIKDYQSLPSVDCFPSQLNQVFINILTNGIDALDESYTRELNLTVHPTIKIRTKLLQQLNCVQVDISDNGLGIPPRIQDRIFDPFFTTKPVGKGTGLGMSISYKIIVEKHHGRLECQSERNMGTHFIITLPIGESPR